MSKKHKSIGRHLYFIFVCVVAPILICGCAHLNEGYQSKATFKEANELFKQGNYKASLSKYEQITDPASADRVLFETGIIYSYPANETKNYQKSLECFQKLVGDYPESVFRKDSEMMIFNINNVIIKDQTIASQQQQIESLRQEIKNKANEILELHNNIESLQKEIAGKQNEITELQNEFFANLKTHADKVLVEKRERRLTLLSSGKALRTYKIALGGNPIGPKERKGDNKTPEGSYIIDARNKDSRYHLALHISYPNEKDKERAKELGVSPGGDIMIHGLKKDLSWVGDRQSQIDWTKGCIAVTDKEIEEIDRLVPNGTVVEIRP